MNRSLLRSVFVSCLWPFAQAVNANIISCTFEPGPPTFSGNWSASGNWGAPCGNGIVPNNGGGNHYFATVSPAFGANQAIVDIDVALDKIAIDDPNNDDGVRVDVSNNFSLTLENSGLAGSGVSNVSGALHLNSIGNVTALTISGDNFIGGNMNTGLIELSNQSTNQIRGDGGGDDMLTLEFVDIRGAGKLGTDNLTISTNGVVEANKSAGLVVDPDDIGGYTNNGVLRASDSATLTLLDGTFTNTGHQIEALDGSKVVLNAATILGGVLDTTGSGRFEVTGTSTLDGIGLINSGVIDVLNNRTLHLLGAITNQGAINLLSLGNTTDLSLRADVLLNGGGTINFSNQALNRIRSDTSVGTFTLTNEDNLIRGSGNIGDNNSGFINRGTVRADQSTALTIDPRDSLGFANEGVVEVTNGATLNVGAGSFETSGTIQVEAGATLARTGVYVQSGGATTVQGSLNASGQVLINGGLLAGNGTITGNVENAAQVGPGTSIGQLDIIGNFTQKTTGDLLLEVAALNDFDVLDITGNANLGGTVVVSLLNGYLPEIGDTFTFLVADAVFDNFGSVVCPTCVGGSFIVVTGADFAALTVTAAPVPVPPSVLLFGSALAGFTLIRARRRP